VESCLLWSDWAELACESQEVVGLLICKIVKKDWLGRAIGTASRLFAYFMLVARFILRGPPQELRFLWNFLLTDGKVAKNQPRADAEIQTVIVHSSHRGEGIARALVDRFISAARQEAQIRTVRVYTTPPLTNWRFYEIYGFKRMGMFHDNLASSYVASRDANGFFYLLTL
jgi:ribosomal protein S18 acetylase RimI-like enzyme